MTLLTVKQAAKQLGCSQSLIYQNLGSGRLVGIRIGCRGRGSWRIEPEELDAFLASCRTTEEPLKYLGGGERDRPRR